MNASKKAQETLSPAILKLYADALPDFFTRAQAAELSNGILSRDTLAYLEHSRSGPPIHYVGRKACYVKEEFIAWMENYYGGMHVKFTGFGRQLCRAEGASGSSTGSGGGPERTKSTS